MGRYPPVQRVTPRLVRFFGFGLWGPIPSGLGRRVGGDPLVRMLSHSPRSWPGHRDDLCRFLAALRAAHPLFKLLERR
jgi:hypothetical protein